MHHFHLREDIGGLKCTRSSPTCNLDMAFQCKKINLPIQFALSYIIYKYVGLEITKKITRLKNYNKLYVSFIYYDDC